MPCRGSTPDDYAADVTTSPEMHLSHRGGWLRAAVLGANDGILSTAGLVLGVAAANASTSAIATAGVAGLVAGGLSMAAGEYVSVSSQRDAELADLRLEKRELESDPEGELAELAAIYVERGLSPDLALQVAEELTAGDALAVHARDELGIDENALARPIQAAWSSAVAFAFGAALPLLAITLTPGAVRIGLTVAVTLLALAVLGGIGARLGGAPMVRAALRVAAWGAVAMALTSAIGALVGAAV
jgi:VIT1/CCC1 family predicted Fe2+/Mn2+ transporter